MKLTLPNTKIQMRQQTNGWGQRIPTLISVISDLTKLTHLNHKQENRKKDELVMS